MPGILQELIAITAPTMKNSFAQHAVAASQSNVQLPLIATDAASGTLTVTDVPMPFAATPVVITVSLSVSPAGGNLTLTITKNDSALPITLQLVVVPGAPKTYYAVFEAGQDWLQPGDTLGLQITTAAGWTATTADIFCEVWWVAQDARF
jgi:hypothetical protein